MLHIDYKYWNKVTLRNQFSLPIIHYLFDQLEEENIFSKIELRSRHHQGRIKDVYIGKEYFRAMYGHYEFIMVSFGLINAPTTSMFLMNVIFKQHLDKFFFLSWWYSYLLIFRGAWRTLEVSIRSAKRIPTLCEIE